MGAWIETATVAATAALPRVAPHVGAWIETCQRVRQGRAVKSHPMWVRGLKRQ